MAASNFTESTWQHIGRTTRLTVLACAALLGHPVRATDATVAPPDWAYPVSPPLTPIEQVSDAQVPQSLPGARVQYTKAQLRNLYTALDWRPETHPAMPTIVASGRKPAVFACAYCHQPNGVGRPENANLTGLSAGYMQRQLADYRAGLRRSSVSAMLPQTLMVKVASQATQEELDAAITYFTSLPVDSTVSVVEADDVPRSRPNGWALMPLAQGGSERLGTRIVELPNNPAATELRDSAATFTAYVPRGALERGRKLAMSGDGLLACALCHGPQLRGVGDVPPIAGRSPSYLIRQLVDFSSGARAGQMSAQMQAVANAMSESDMIAAVAYAASLKP